MLSSLGTALFPMPLSLRNTSFAAEPRNESVYFPLGPAVAGSVFSVRISPERLPAWNYSGGASVEIVQEVSSCGGRGATVPDFGWAWSPHHTPSWIASFTPIPRYLSSRTVYLCIGTQTPQFGTIYFISTRPLFIHPTFPSYIVTPLSRYISPIKSTVHLKGVQIRDTTELYLLTLNRIGAEGVIPCDVLAVPDIVEVPVEEGRDYVRLEANLRNSSGIYEVPSTFLENMHDGRTTAEVFICLTLDSKRTFTALPYDTSGVSENTVFSEKDYTTTFYADTLNSSVSGATLRCPGVMIAGLPTSCSLHFMQNNSTNFTPEAFTLDTLRDGDGTEICPKPSLIYASPITFSFTPIHHGSSGAVSFRYEGIPIVLNLLHNPWYNETYRNNLFDYEFTVSPTYMDADTLLDEILLDGGYENGGSDGSWTNTTGVLPLTPRQFREQYLDTAIYKSKPLPAAGGAECMIPDPEGTTVFSQSASSIEVTEALNLQISFSYAAYYDTYHAKYLSSGSLANYDTKMTISYSSFATTVTSTITFYHTSSQFFVQTAMYGDPNGVTTKALSLPMDWETFKYVHTEELVYGGVKIDVRSIEVKVESIGGRGFVTMFDSFSVKNIELRLTDEKEKVVLEEIYRMSLGASWFAADNWLTMDPCRNHWRGVGCIPINDKLRVVSLILPQNNLNGDFPELSPLEHLNTLIISGNRISGHLNNVSHTIHTLDVSHNSLQGVSFFGSNGGSNAPLVYGNIQRICAVKVDLSYNVLTVLPSALLGDIEEVAEVYHSEQSLRKVFLEAGVVTVRTVERRVEVLDASHNRIGNVVGGVVRTFRVHAALRVLSLSHNALQGGLPEAMNTSLPFALSVLDVANNRFSGEVPPSYSQFLGLRLLSLANNQLEGALPDLSLLSQIQRARVLATSNSFSGYLPAWTVRTALIDVRGCGFKCPLPKAPPGVMVQGFDAGLPGRCDAG